tara:strand:+ start:2623 stop:3102 length:480 start_codon:yes stop_codon:yes gene_type:complete
MALIAVYPGTFDPITNGHVDLANRGCKLFSKVVIAVAKNPQKNTLFTIDERVGLIEEIFNKDNNVEVYPLDSLLVDFAASHDASVILRGLRAVSDFEYEVQLASMNRSLSPAIESVFMSPAEKYSFLSSSIIKDIARHHGNIDGFVHQAVATALKNKFE